MTGLLRRREEGRKIYKVKDDPHETCVKRLLTKNLCLKILFKTIIEVLRGKGAC